MQNVTKATLAMRYIGRVLPVLRYGGEPPKLPAELDWGTVFAVARMHSLASSIWYVLEPIVRADAPRELADKWESQRTMDYAKNLVQTREFVAVTAMLTEAKIRFLPMKGFLFKSIWARPEHRTMADMDFLVGAEDIPRVSELLLARGYKIDVEDGAVHDTFDKPPYLHIEIHRSLFTDDTDGFDKWVAREDNPYWYVMRPHDFLTFNIGHIHKHFIGGGCGARSLFDVYLYLRELGDGVDRSLLDEALREKGLDEFYHKLLHLVYFWYAEGECPFTPDERYIDNGQPTDELIEMEHFIVTGGSYGLEKNRVELAVERQGKLRYILSIAFPKYRIMRRKYPILKKCPILLPLFYPWRWITYFCSGKVTRFTKYIFGKKK